jgi:hypothetical protein
MAKGPAAAPEKNESTLVRIEPASLRPEIVSLVGGVKVDLDQTAVVTVVGAAFDAAIKKKLGAAQYQVRLVDKKIADAAKRRDDAVAAVDLGKFKNPGEAAKKALHRLGFKFATVEVKAGKLEVNEQRIHVTVTVKGGVTDYHGFSMTDTVPLPPAIAEIIDEIAALQQEKEEKKELVEQIRDVQSSKEANQKQVAAAVYRKLLSHNTGGAAIVAQLEEDAVALVEDELRRAFDHAG